jgi:chromosome segregation ATPase
VEETLKKANTENRSLRSDLEAARKRDADRDRQLASAEEKIKSLEARLAPAEATSATLVPATESAKEACYTLRLALNDLGARAEGSPNGRRRRPARLSKWQAPTGTVVLMFRRDSFSASCTRTAVTTSGIFPIL